MQLLKFSLINRFILRQGKCTIFQKTVLFIRLSSKTNELLAMTNKLERDTCQHASATQLQISDLKLRSLPNPPLPATAAKIYLFFWTKYLKLFLGSDAFLAA